MDESDSYINLSNNKVLTECDVDNNRVRSQLKQQIHKQKSKDNGWRFVKLTSMTNFLNKGMELKGAYFVEIPTEVQLR